MICYIKEEARKNRGGVVDICENESYYKSLKF